MMPYLFIVGSVFIFNLDSSRYILVQYFAVNVLELSV